MFHYTDYRLANVAFFFIFLVGSIASGATFLAECVTVARISVDCGAGDATVSRRMKAHQLGYAGSN